MSFFIEASIRLKNVFYLPWKYLQNYSKKRKSMLKISRHICFKIRNKKKSDEFFQLKIREKFSKSEIRKKKTFSLSDSISEMFSVY